MDFVLEVFRQTDTSDGPSALRTICVRANLVQSVQRIWNLPRVISAEIDEAKWPIKCRIVYKSLKKHMGSYSVDDNCLHLEKIR